MRGERGCKREKERAIRDARRAIWESGVSGSGISRRSKLSTVLNILGFQLYEY